jgi:hypothetical protein
MTTLNETSLGCLAQGVEGDMTQCVVEATFAAGPSPGIIGLMLGGVVLTALYVGGNGNVTVPAIAMILFGALLIPTLPPQFTIYAYTVTAIGITAAAFAAYTRFTTRGGFR